MNLTSMLLLSIFQSNLVDSVEETWFHILEMSLCSQNYCCIHVTVSMATISSLYVSMPMLP